jgi:hypothetical protein
VEIEGVGLASLLEEPQRARGGQPQTKRVGSDDATELPTLIMAQASEGIDVTTLDFNGLVVSIRLQRVLHLRPSPQSAVFLASRAGIGCDTGRPPP